MKEYRERMSQNRNTLYHYFKDSGMLLRFTYINDRQYKVFIPEYKWENVYLTINGSIRFTDFQSIILFSNELVVRFNMYDTCQVNIPYRLIDTVQIDNELDIGYEEIHLNKQYFLIITLCEEVKI